MGTITKADTIETWLSQVSKSRDSLINAAKTGNRVAAAFAMADARVELLQSLQSEAIRAKLLRITDPRIHQVELANNPSDEDRVRICALAILNGFTPGEDEFTIFGGRGGGTLYVKEAGFRTLFSHLGIVPDDNIGHPEWRRFGEHGKYVWQVTGEASCEYRGKTYRVEFAAKFPICIPGNETDGVDSVAAKARRRLLKALWKHVSPILNDDMEEDEQTAEVVVTPKIEQSDKWAPYRDEFGNSSSKAKELAERVIACDDLESIRGIFADATQYMQAGTFNQRDLDRLERLCKFAKSQLS